MMNPAPVALESKSTLWTGRVFSALPTLFLLMDGGAKLFKPAPVVQTMTELGYPESVIVGTGIVLLGGVLLYLVPRTAVLGAILLTGYLGGAIATHVRVGSNWFSWVLPILLGGMLWGGLFLRDVRVRALIPVREV